MKNVKMWIVIGFMSVLLGFGLYAKCTDVPHTSPDTEVGDHEGPEK